MRGSFIRPLLIVAGALTLAACGGATAATPPPSQTAPHFYITINTPDQLGVDENLGPAFIPASFTLPANSDVMLTVVNFDDATPLTGDSVQYATATGIKGSFAVETLDPTKPNDAGTVTMATKVDPNDVSHTFTIAKLGLNVPIVAKSKVTFTFHTGAAGTYSWHCMDPCGAGAAGWNGAMALPGRMAGTVTVV